MKILDALLPYAKAFIREIAGGAREVVRAVLKEVDESAFGRAATGFIEGATRTLFGKAQDLADEEAEIARKTKSDGKASEKEADRLREIQEERDRLRKEFEAASARDAANDLRKKQDVVAPTSLTDDEISGEVGVLADKKCPRCGGRMGIRQRGGYSHSRKTHKRKFFWQCTVSGNQPCPQIDLDVSASKAAVIRPSDPDLDGNPEERRKIWTRQDVSNQTHQRVRSGLEERDEGMICPNHLLPMKLVENRDAGRRMLDSYHYICVGVTPEGLACPHAVSVDTYPQVAAMLRRREGRGIIH